MVTSSEFDKVLVPVDYQKDVLMRTFDSLIGFNKKNKKGKFMKAIKEEYVWDPVKGRPVFVDREKEAKEKSKGYKLVKLDKPKKEKNDDIKIKKTANTVDVSEPKEKKVAKKDDVISSTLINKNGRTAKDLERERKESLKAPTFDVFYRNLPKKGDDKLNPDNGYTREEALKKAHEMEREAKAEAEKLRNFVDDTHYTVDEIVDYAWKHSKRTREKFLSDKDFRKELINKKALRDLYDKRMIEVLGHKPEDAKKKVSKEAKAQKVAQKAAKVKEAAELETDVNKIADWFWDHKSDSSYKTLFDNTNSKYTLARLIKNDDRGLKFFAKIMRDRGYVKKEEKPNTLRAVLIKKSKSEAACDFEREGEAAKEFKENVNDKTFKTILPFFTSWAKEYGIKLTPEAIKAFKEHVFKTIVYHNTMGILHGDN